MKVRLEIILKEFAERLKARAEDVPEYKVKTPLQRSVQLFKRHRDMTFMGDPDDKPVSILITTLAGHAYNNEPDILEALVNIVSNMPKFIENKNGVLWVANPVNPSENFADKWQEYPQRQEVFFNWLHKAQKDILELVNTHDSLLITKSLTRQFGEAAVSRAITSIAPSNTAYLSSGITMANKPPTTTTIHKPDRPWGDTE